MRIKQAVGSNMYELMIYVCMILFCITTLYPFYYLLTLSITSASVPYSEIHIIPPAIDFAAYENVFADEYILKGFINTAVRTVLGTLVTLVVTVLLAYPLSKKYLPNRSMWTGLIVFTMYFSGGLIPTYLLIKSLNLFNTTWVLILPHLINTFEMIIVRNFFMAIPESLEESARIDGANDFLILFAIIIPISMPIIATLVMWTAVYHWNEWFDALVYISISKKQVLQNIMRRTVLDGIVYRDELEQTHANPENIKAATIIVTTLPIVMVYPFIQKHFIKGVMIGALKG